jgi:hypothetical protein
MFLEPSNPQSPLCSFALTSLRQLLKTIKDRFHLRRWSQAQSSICVNEAPPNRYKGLYLIGVTLYILVGVTTFLPLDFGSSFTSWIVIFTCFPRKRWATFNLLSQIRENRFPTLPPFHKETISF